MYYMLGVELPNSRRIYLSNTEAQYFTLHVTMSHNLWGPHAIHPNEEIVTGELHPLQELTLAAPSLLLYTAATPSYIL